ncbi:conserved protein of unknown function [Georgfuchsia toluolica]|uniref:BioF2-like acetyltransferase domain-containing protein n=1 Tax=Georgfuchsia toluolica TaxID=424218 RepID=A0A916J2F3_9PROT|nr:conserved protein of unknown function [Georgfuchsia toluolica]
MRTLQASIPAGVCDAEAFQCPGQHAYTAGAALPFTRVRVVSPAEISPVDISAWVALEAEALQPNAYMSPHFVLPALRYLDRPPGTRILLVERVGAGAVQTVAVAVLCRLTATRLLLAPHHSIYRSRHSYLGAPLLHREFATDAANHLFTELARHRWSAAGLILPNVDPEGPLLAAFSEACRSRGLALQTTREWQRATLIPSRAGEDTLRNQKKYKRVERCRRRLAELGDLQWLIHREGVDDEIIESFLRLEHSGWKGRRHKSLRSRLADEAFFREMATGFAREGRALFTELRLNGRTIASTSNFASAHAGFAFKVGWDEAFRKFSVGNLIDAELVERAPEVCNDLAYIDSGSGPHSHMEVLWPHRRSLVTVFLPYSTAGQLAWQGMQSLRSLRRFV